MASRFFSLLLGCAMLSILLYLIVRTTLFFTADYSWTEKGLAAALLLAELFTMIHAFGYFLNLLHVTRNPDEARRVSMSNVPALENYPPVAIIVSSFHEPLDVIEDTLTCFYNLTYPNKHIYFLDDTRYDEPGRDLSAYRAQVDELCARIGVNLFRRPWRGAKAGMINDFLHYLHGEPPAGFVMTSFEDVPSRLDEKYVILFDADMNPLPDFVEPLVAFMEDNPRLAFIQTPQYYSNFEHNRVARAAGLQQAVFYEYICEGKSTQDAMFCCGTNVIFNRKALWDVGGFEESSVTEDFATSLKFHENGWSSAYLNKVCAFGMGPEDLGSYFKQQFRWALGTVGLFRTIIGAFFRNPTRMSAAKWWEYFLSGTHYFVGWILFIMMLCPILFLFFNVPSYFAKPEIYFLFFAPYIILTLALFLFSMGQRRYSVFELAEGVILQAICFPVYMKASLLGILGFRGTFGITPKAGATSLPMRNLWMQLILAVGCFAAVWWGGLRLWYESDMRLALATNTAWCLYHFLILSTMFWFNAPEEN